MTRTTDAGATLAACAVFLAAAGAGLGASVRTATSGPAALPPAAADKTTMTAVDARDRERRPLGTGKFSRMVRHAELTGQAELAGSFSRTIRQAELAGQAELTGQAKLAGNLSRTARQAELNCIAEAPLERAGW